MSPVRSRTTAGTPEPVQLDLALTLIDGGQAISDFQALAHLAPVIGPVPSTPTVWRTLNEIGGLPLARVNAAVTEFRRHWWGLLADRPQGFPWLKAAGKELTGITVLEPGASVVFCGSEKENAKAAYKGGTGFCPNLAACGNTGDMLAVDPRPGNSASNCAAGNIALLTRRSPGCRDPSAAACWPGWTGRVSPVNCWSTSPRMAASGAGEPLLNNRLHQVTSPRRALSW